MNSHYSILMEAMRHANRQIRSLSKQQLSLKIVGGFIAPLTAFVETIPQPDTIMSAAVIGMYTDNQGHPEFRFVFAVERQALSVISHRILGEQMASKPAMAQSLLQEIANIGASAIANHIGGRLGERIHVSAPDVMHETWACLGAATLGSFLDPADEIVMLTTEVRMSQTTFPGCAYLFADRNADLQEKLVLPGMKGV